MGVTKLYKMYQVNINNTPTAVDFPATQNVGHSAGLTRVMFDGGGQIDSTGVATLLSDQRLTFSTTDIKALLDVAGINGKKLVTPNDFLAAFWQQYDQGGLIKAGSTHLKILINEGLLIPRIISVTQGAEASIDCEAIPTFDGTNDPLVVSDSQALVTRVNASQLWTLGKATINSVDIEIQSLNIDFGIQEKVVGADGDVFNTFVAIDKRDPSITFDSFDISKLTSFVHQGSDPGGTFVCYLRKLKAGGTRVADATAEHIKFTINDYQISPENTNAAKDGQAGTSYSIKPVFDGSNNIIVIDTASIIT